MIDIIERFSDFRIQTNIYDGGSQIFFYPVPVDFEFSALSFRIEKETIENKDIESIIFQHVAFKFGNELVLGRDGYHMKR
ncbi:MAG: hypothetical protein ABI402_04465 [Ferruginibacter sp.]